jgi:hypothetical protein
MRRVVVWLFLTIGLVGCSTRTYVVQPDEVPKLNDSQWDIKSRPAGPR